MKKCTNSDCLQTFGEAIEICPSSGQPLTSDLESVDGYTLFEIVQEISSGVFY